MDYATATTHVADPRSIVDGENDSTTREIAILGLEES
jgi:hypothetical protein